MSDADRYLPTQGLNYMLHQQYYLNDWAACSRPSSWMVPTLVVYAIFQGRIQKGLTVGALKGWHPTPPRATHLWASSEHDLTASSPPSR